MKEYKVKRYGRDRRHQKTAATLKTVLMVLLIAGACAAGWFLYDPISAWLTEKAEEHQQRQEHIAAQPGPDGHRRTVDGEDPQTDGVRHQQQCLPVPVIALGVKALPHQKHQQGRGDGHQCL